MAVGGAGLFDLVEGGIARGRKIPVSHTAGTFGLRVDGSTKRLSAATAADIILAHEDLLSFRDRLALYNLRNYSLHRINIALRMQGSRRERSAQSTAEQLFGAVLREFRQNREMTQETLAFESGYHPTCIGQLERRVKSPSLRKIMGLPKFLHTPGSEILRQVEERLGKT